MNLPSDQSQRERFIGELDRNFSVVAAAGSGKTRAITDRIVALARHPNALEWLPRLLVVTYTNRAAAEMQQRARQSIIEAQLGTEVVAAFNRAFFGTIHSLCTMLLRQHGHHLGLSGQLDHLDDASDSALWTKFVQEQATIGESLEPEERWRLLRIVSAQKLMGLGRDGHSIDSPPPVGPFPTLDFSQIYAFTPTRRSSQPPVERSRAALRRWERAWVTGGFAGPLPPCESVPLEDVWDAAITPLRAWVRRASLLVASETARRYRDFRLRHGLMTYDDQIAIAAALLRHPEAGPRIRGKAFRVILDEAQDTDPAQFDVLLQIARPPEAGNNWLDEDMAPPRPGHFCMVGDFQQSIFSDRADLDHYRRVHQKFLETGAGEALEFSVTFRLDEAGVAFINAALPAVLTGVDRQVSYVPLNPRPTVLPGQVVRVDFGMPRASMDWAEWQKGRWEADQLAHWIRDQGLEKLRASSWSEVALLCPRNRWLPGLQAALRKVGLEGQVQSQRAIKGDSPAYAWFSALAIIMAEPRNSFEIVGVLREVYGISDQDLATFSEGKGWRFQVALQNVRGGIVGQTLNQLAELRAEATALPLFSAMQKMVHATKLRERLAALPAEDYEGVENEVDSLLTRAAVAEAGGATLELFAADLGTHFTSTREVKSTTPDSLQIISGHKAKGSEWDAVIVPFFARKVSTKSSIYPRMLRHPHTREFLAALDDQDVDRDLKAMLDIQTRQELERLLYVALTRARHTLVLVDDRSLFAGAKGLPKNAQASLARCAALDTHAALFEALPTNLAVCPATAAWHAEKSVSRNEGASLPALIPLPTESLSAGRERASFFVKRNPSALAEAASADADPTATAPLNISAGPNAGQLYGTWWHEFVERMDWAAGESLWKSIFADALRQSPDPNRSQREWKLLQKLLTNGSDLGRILTAPGAIAHAELPFLWAMSERECLDGIIDLAVRDPATGAWLILDWKTNNTTVGQLPKLSDHYLPQLSAYWQAVGQMLDAPVSAGIYSTVTGRWLPYPTEALAAAWDRLRVNSTELERVLSEA